jgi:hypothetical protein
LPDTDGVIVLEDLRARGATMVDATVPMSVDAVRGALDTGRPLCFCHGDAHEEELLRGYLLGLAERGADPAPNWDDAWTSYRRHAVHGLLWFLCPTQMQPLEVITASVGRFATAATDHGADALFAG